MVWGGWGWGGGRERENYFYLYEMERERELLISLPLLSSEILRESSRVYLTRLVDVLSQLVSFCLLQTD